MILTDAISKIEKRFQELNKSIFILSILFGISSWVVFAGIWVESPLLIKALPEGWALPSLIGAVAQFGQIGPILLYFLKCQMFSCCPGRFLEIRIKRVPDRVIIYTLFAFGLVSLATIAIFWQQTMFIFGKERSVPFFIGVFFLAILDCTCTIVFLTYIGKFSQNYVTALYIGEGISSLLPSLFALAQGTGEETKCVLNDTNLTIIENMDIKITPNFSVSVYFWLLFLTLLVSFASFAALDLIPYYKQFRGPVVRRNDGEPEENYTREGLMGNQVITRTVFNKEKINSAYDKALLLIAITLVSFLLYGFIPGLSSYSTLSYGSNVMHLSITLALITQPISSLIATFIQIKSTKQVYILLSVCFGIAGYIILMACLSPCPLLSKKWIGGVFMVLAWIFVYAFLMYLRCCITSLLKKRYGAQSLMICGLLTQVGQFIGSILIYVLVDFGKLFKEAEPCTDYNCLI